MFAIPYNNVMLFSQPRFGGIGAFCLNVGLPPYPRARANGNATPRNLDRIILLSQVVLLAVLPSLGHSIP